MRMKNDDTWGKWGMVNRQLGPIRWVATCGVSAKSGAIHSAREAAFP